MVKRVATVVGIRPDFIRMSKVIEELDKNFEHTLIHTGQHFDDNLSRVFFKDLDIRKPDINLSIGGSNKPHYAQTAELSVKLCEFFKGNRPDLVIYLGDSNSVASSVALKKEGYRIAHIEAGMRSKDKRMLEEINRTVCDVCSDIHFVYHKDYKQHLLKENVSESCIHVVGNTIVEVYKKYSSIVESKPKTKDYVLMDIHRPENFLHKSRLSSIFDFARHMSNKLGLPVKMLSFGRTMQKIDEYNIDTTGINFIDMVGYLDYLKLQYNAYAMFSDSGTAQEEPALFDTPVIVPREYTERPQSMLFNNSFLMENLDHFDAPLLWLSNYELKIIQPSKTWLGNGKTAELITNTIKELKWT